MSTEHEKVEAKATGRRYDSVDALMANEGVPPEVQSKVAELARETRIVLQLARLRTTCGITQEDMGKHLGVGQAAISKMEAGRDEDLTIREIREYAKATGKRIAMMFGKPMTHVESVKGHAEGIRHHLQCLAKIANQNDDMEKEIQAFFGEAFFTILTILSKCNEQLPNKAGEFTMSMEITKQDSVPTCAPTLIATDRSLQAA